MRGMRTVLWGIGTVVVVTMITPVPVVEQPVQAQAQNLVEIDGDVEVLVEDHPTSPIVRYFLTANGRRREMRFVSNPPGLLTGQRVRVRGIERPDGTLQIDSGSSVESAALTSMQQVALGPQSTIVILVYPNSAPSTPYTSALAESVMAQTSQHFNWGSYGQTTVAATVVGWYGVDYDPTVCDSGTIASQADAAATSHGYNLANYKRKVYAFPDNACTWWGLGSVGGNPSRAWVNGTFALQVVAHELGHNLGLYHANALDCGSQTTGSSCTTIGYGNTIDTMGNYRAGDFNLFMKERLGWVNAGVSPPLETVTTDGTYFIGPYEAQTSASKGLKVLKSTDPITLKKTYYYLEFRQALNADAFLSSSTSGNANVLNGIVFTTGSESSVDSSLMLDLTPATTSWYDPALTDSLAFTDPDSGLTVQTLSTDPSGANIMVTFGPVPCIPGMPAVTIQPAPAWVQPGSTANYTVTVTNTDNQVCDPTTFNLSSVVPAGWGSVLGSPSILLASGQSVSSPLSVTPPAGTANGYYSVAASAVNSANTVFSGQASFLQPVSNGTLGVTAASSKPSYRTAENITLTATVRLGTTPVPGAAVTFSVLKSGSSTPTVYNATTNASGVASVTFKFKVKPSPVGTYNVTAAANINGSTGSGTTTFAVTK